MQSEIIMVGTELLLGQIQDTNATYMARALARAGIPLYWKTTVGDNHGRIVEALRRGLDRSDALLCSGGLGPTADDITRECVADVLGLPLEYHEDLYQVISDRFRSRNRPLTENNRRQACLPAKAAPIHNPHGTAPGLIAEQGGKSIICMPGVPSELYPMLDEVVLPYLAWRFDIRETIFYRVLVARGVGESRVDAQIADLIEVSENPTIGLLASPGMVRIRIAARGRGREQAISMILPVENEIRRRLVEVAGELDLEDTLLEQSAK